MIPTPAYTPPCNPVGITTNVNCMLLMYETPGDMTRPTVQFYWTPDIDNVTRTWIDYTSMPSKYNMFGFDLGSSSFTVLGPAYSGIRGYSR